MEGQFTGEGFRTLAMYRLFFQAALRTQIEARADYDQEVRDWYENGDGRPVRFEERADSDTGIVYRVNVGGQGHAFPVCIHGASRWTDYDNICGPCEESLTAIEEARLYARERFVRFNERWDWLTSAPADLPHETRQSLTAWTTALLPEVPWAVVGQFVTLSAPAGSVSAPSPTTPEEAP